MPARLAARLAGGRAIRPRVCRAVAPGIGGGRLGANPQIDTRQAVTGRLEAIGRRAQGFGGPAIRHDELGPHDLAEMTSHDEPDGPELRMLETAFEGRGAVGAVGAEPIDDLGEEAIHAVGLADPAGRGGGRGRADALRASGRRPGSRAEGGQGGDGRSGGDLGFGLTGLSALRDGRGVRAGASWIGVLAP